MLPAERIRVGVKVDNWRDAIREAGILLFDTGAVTFEYIEAMIKTAEELGPYIVLAPGIALPHAATEAGARQTALSLVRLDDPIAFGNPDNDPVRLVFALSAIDKKAHIVALQALAEVFLSKELMDQVFEADNVETLVEIFYHAESMVKHQDASNP
jgi:mannitol/fructose-specific phosphotransferase system IIA component (Ntr-type)